MPATYEGMGIRFQYPENWNLDEETDEDGPSSVTVYSPGGAFWSVALHPASVDPQELLDSAVEAMRQEYDGLESAATSVACGGHKLVGVEMNFIYLDLVSDARVLYLRLPDFTISIYCQGEDREFESLSAVFEAMTTSLLSNIGGI